MPELEAAATLRGGVLAGVVTVLAGARAGGGSGCGWAWACQELTVCVNLGSDAMQVNGLINKQKVEDSTGRCDASEWAHKQTKG